MSEDTGPRIPTELQPQPGDFDYDLHDALAAIVSLRARIPDDAFTASILGTERGGHGVMIANTDLIVTIGYLITEAEEIWLVSQSGHALLGHVVGYDYESGLGLVQPLGTLEAPSMQVGTTRALQVGEDVVVAGYGGLDQSIKARIASKREFAGYWEYVLDEAVFTSPPHPNWGGAALISSDGRLCGVGSLYIDQILAEMSSLDGNMCVPIDLLEPIKDELMTYGRTLKPARPWLGVFISEAADKLMVAGAYEDAPAAQAELRAGDIVLAVAGEPVAGLAKLFRSIWALGPAGTEVPLTVHREGNTFETLVQSVDRRDFWRTPSLH